MCNRRGTGGQTTGAAGGFGERPDRPDPGPPGYEAFFRTHIDCFSFVLNSVGTSVPSESRMRISPSFVFSAIPTWSFPSFDPVPLVRIMAGVFDVSRV